MVTLGKWLGKRYAYATNSTNRGAERKNAGLGGAKKRNFRARMGINGEKGWLSRKIRRFVSFEKGIAPCRQ